MTTEVPTRTITEMKNGEGVNLSILCVPSMQDDGSENPTIYSSKVLEEPLTIDAVKGTEGELIISSEETNAGSLNTAGDFIVNTEIDDADKYSVDQTKGDLLYEE